MKNISCIALFLLVFSAVLAVPAQADCPDGYWDCLKPGSGGMLVATGGSVVYGRCFSWRTRTCSPCWADDTRALGILGRCNREVVECDHTCNAYADLKKCCDINSGCGNLDNNAQLTELCENV